MVLRSKVPADRLVLLDEAYAEFVRGDGSPDDAVDGSSLIGRYPNLVLLRTFSKAYGLAGLRVGYAIGPIELLDAARATLEAHGNAEAGDGTVPRGLHDVTGRPCRGDSTPLSARRVLASSCLSQSRFSCLEPDHLLSVA